MKCEVCKKRNATSISFVPYDNSCRPYSGEWKLACGCTNNSEFYYIIFEPDEHLLMLPSWLEHLEEKNWFAGTKNGFLRCWNKVMEQRKMEGKEAVRSLR